MWDGVEIVVRYDRHGQPGDVKRPEVVGMLNDCYQKARATLEHITEGER